MSTISIYTTKIKLLYRMIMIVIFRFLFGFMKTKSHWIILERGTDARDNAYFFYKYMKRTHPEQKVYYVIDKKSKDYEKVKEDAIEYRGLKTLIKVYTADKIVSSHYGTAVPGISGKFFYITGLNKKMYFLQHGITQCYHYVLTGEKAKMNLFVCGACPEYQYIKENFGHPEGVVRYTGLARFDNLHNFDLKKQILVMPTWRMWCDYDFENSDYYKCWNNLLKDKKLIEYLEKNDISLVFYPHYQIQKYIHLFESASKNIIIASFNDYDVQTLLKESALLVTDFSSVYFDFAYMKKPIVYYQFDKERFFSQHYSKGYFNYDTMGFGKVCDKHEETINEIIKSIENDFSMEQMYLDRVEGFFPLHDTKNCERIYNAILEN